MMTSNTKPLRVGTAVVLLWLTSACTDDASDHSASADDSIGYDTDSAGEADSEVSAPEDAEIAPSDALPGRVARRISVEQLARSIPILTGGIEWTEDFGNGPVNMLQLLEASLGQPDYRLVTTENLEPNLILAKFVSDTANRLCVDWVDAEQTRSAAERTLLRHASFDSLDTKDVRTTLEWLELRLFGRSGAAMDASRLDGLEALFVAAAHAPGSLPLARNGWIAVCIAALTDPELVVY